MDLKKTKLTGIAKVKSLFFFHIAPGKDTIQILKCLNCCGISVVD